MLTTAMPLWLYVGMLVLVAALCLAVVALGHRSRSGDSPCSTDRWLGGCLLALWVVYNVYYFHPVHFDWGVSLPLHACDVIALAAGLMLVYPVRIVRSVVYFSAIGLTTQALITPVGNQDPAALRFWLYWLLHGGIIAASVYDIAIRGYRPLVRDLRHVVWVDLLYFIAIFPLDAVFGWNYGYLGPDALDEATVLDLLGPWPLRAFAVLGLVVLVQLIMLLLGGAVRRRTSLEGG